MNLNKTTKAVLLAAGAALLASSTALAHVTSLPGQRTFQEGSEGIMTLRIGEACTPETGTQAVTTVFPNGDDDEVYELKLDPATLAVTANPVGSTVPLGSVLMGDAFSDIRPDNSREWDAVIPKTDASGRVRAIQWQGGFVPNSFFERVEWHAMMFAEFQPNTCFSKVRIYTPSRQFCSATAGGPIVASKWWAWAGIPEAGLPANPVPPGFTKAVEYVPYFDLNRNLAMNPLPRRCGGGGEYGDEDEGRRMVQQRPGRVLGVYPSETSIWIYAPAP